MSINHGGAPGGRRQDQMFTLKRLQEPRRHKKTNKEKESERPGSMFRGPEHKVSSEVQTLIYNAGVCLRLSYLSAGQRAAARFAPDPCCLEQKWQKIGSW